MDDIEMARVEKTPKEIDEEIKRKKEIQVTLFDWINSC